MHILFGGHIWLATTALIVIVALVVGVAAFLVRQQATNSQQAAAAYPSQPLSVKAQASLNAAPLAAEDYLIGGSLNVAGIFQANRLTGSADMLIGSQDHALTLQGSNIALAASVGGSTNTLRFALPNGASKTITVPNASGTIAVSASGPLVLDTNGNLSCPSCGASAASVTNVTNTTITNVTNNNVTNAVGVTSLNAASGDMLLQGTANQVVVTNNGSGGQTITLSLPQDMNTGASPVFANLNLTQSLQVADTVTAGSIVRTPSLDTVNARQLSIGASTATSILLGADTSTAAGKSFTVNGNALFKNNINSTSAFQIQDTSGVALLNANTAQGTLSVGAYVPTVVWSTAPVTKTDYVAGANPQGVIKADVNGDGKVDLIVSNISSDTVSVFLNNGNGTFAAKVDYATGVNPRGVTSADFNGDGKPDLAIGNWGANTISILLNNGNGTFAPKVDYVANSKPQNPISADFNGDGKPDVAVAYSGSNTVSILLNNGNGTFAPKVDYATGVAGVTSWAVTNADFNGDGKPDLAVTNSSANTVSVFMNNGNGTFAAKVDYATGTTAYGVAAADFNGDAKVDLTVTNVNDSTVSVFLNNGNGTFAPKVDYTTGGSPTSVIAVDLNNDTKADLAVTNQTSNTVSVFLGNGSGTFAAKVDYTTGGGPTAITSADFNGDGTIDLATANNSGSNMSVLLFGATTGTPVAQVASKLVVNSGANAVGQIIQGTAGQTADLLQVRDDLNKTLFSIGSTGTITAANALNVAGALIGTGDVLFKNAVNSTTAFQVQQVSGTNVLSVDTNVGRVAIGTASPGNYRLSVNALATSDNSAQVAISTGMNNSKGLVVQGVSGQFVDLLQAQSSTGTVLASISATGTLTVASAVVSGSITINGHIITGGTAPTITAGTAACTTPTISVTGNDTSGKVTVTTGTGCVATGSMATVTFNGAFGATPRIILTPNNANATNLKWYNGNATTTTFTIDTAAIPADATAYTFNYWAVQ